MFLFREALEAHSLCVACDEEQGRLLCVGSACHANKQSWQRYGRKNGDLPTAGQSFSIKTAEQIKNGLHPIRLRHTTRSHGHKKYATIFFVGKNNISGD